MSGVLTSHSPFRKRHQPENGEVAADFEKHDHHPGHADTPTDVEEDVPAFSESEESFSSSIMEDEMDRAEFEPWMDDGGSEGVSIHEGKLLRAHLRSLGANKFIEEYFSKKVYTLRQLVTAFGVRPDLPYGDTWYLRILGKSIERELNRRSKLPQYNTIDDACALLQKAKNIVVITGAGISTSLGIPDFRSRNTGFYSQLLARGYDSPEDVFDIHNFDDDPTVFYSLAKEILPVTDRCSPTHAFIKLLQDKGKLLTNYTQNIDNIEAYAGILPERLIQCHGSWAKATCRKCQTSVPGETIFPDVRAQRVSRCKKCMEMLRLPQPKKRKRRSASSSRSRGQSNFSDDDSDGQYDVPQAGVMKPDIIFFGEKLPNTFFDRLVEEDRDVVDLVIVMGTSMKVAPVSDIPNFINKSVPHIYISREPADHINFDITLLGYCDEVVAELCRRAGWTLNHDKVPRGIVAQVEACEGNGARWRIAAPLPVAHLATEG